MKLTINGKWNENTKMRTDHAEMIGHANANGTKTKR